jgi:uncharacterized caspase-like protein
MPTMPEGATGRRLALVVATGSYVDPTLARLRAPGRDASDLATVLEDAAVGGFEVETVLDAPAESLRRRIAQFCTQIGPHDLALVYLSCHGVLDDRGRLYYATADTDRELLSATAVPSAWLNEQLEDCRSRRQILVLDCCHSGAFAKGAKGESELALRDRFEGRGRVVLTGSRGTEYSFEHDNVVGDDVSSVFTSALVEGLRSGDADRDGDGLVTVSELYDYAYDAVRTKEARQTPTLWTYGAEGDLLVAHSPRGPIVEPAPLPEDLVALLESARPRVREGAVAELAELVQGSDAGRALTAREALERVAAADVPSVAAAARAALGAAPVEDRPQPPQPGAPTSPPGPPPSPPSPAASTDPPAPADPGFVRRRLIAIVIGLAAVIVTTIVIVIVTSGGDQSGPETFHLGGSPRGVAVDEGAWVARYEDEEVTRINSSSDRETFQVGPRPGKVAAGEGSVWVAYDEGRKLARIFPEAKRAPKIPFAEGCKCSITKLAIADGRLWVSSKDAQTVTAFDPQTGEEIGEYGPIPGFEGAFALDKNAIWAVGFDEEESTTAQLTRVDIASFEEKIKFRRRGSYFEGVAYGHERVWIADSENNLVIPFVTATERSDGDVKIESGIYKDDISFTEDFVLLLDPVQGKLNRIDTGTVKLVKPQPIQGYKKEDEVNREWSDLSVGDGFAWVTDPANGTVHKVDYGGA